MSRSHSSIHHKNVTERKHRTETAALFIIYRNTMTHRSGRRSQKELRQSPTPRMSCASLGFRVYGFIGFRFYRVYDRVPVALFDPSKKCYREKAQD